MPILKIQMSVPLEAAQVGALQREASAAVAKVLAKPEGYVCVTVECGKAILFGGTDDPAAFGELYSIGGINSKNNNAIAAAVTEMLKKYANIDGKRFYLSFFDLPATNIAMNGNTFA
eukprot:NODE_7305_length_487_cov_17.646119_g6863_i0.p1 GENE.NODE_7305_length_487_cov_17.646119_g6863_i0~~NODE_7305_length_487_cov_17.646119_g6863_i0.p1  ORF type:complete len:130 (+),score=35.79 NODE_7305_length_487_cov_17.646119_g6863_i0:41-391(+)